jgi:hypothetical protein
VRGAFTPVKSAPPTSTVQVCSSLSLSHTHAHTHTHTHTQMHAKACI